MEMSVRDAVATALWRFHNAALERAVFVYTCARSTIEGTPAGFTVYERQLVMLIDLVHEFCFNARRAIERADRYRPGTLADAQRLRVHSSEAELKLSDFDMPKTIPLTQESFWWVLGRIIHSKETHVVYRTLDIVIDDERTGNHHSIEQPVAFGFSSDRDSDHIDHYVLLESLVMPYLGRVAHHVEEAIRVRNGQ